MSAAGEIVRNALPMFEGRGVAGVPDGFPQIPALVQRGKKRMIRFFDFWNRQLSANQFVAGPNFSIADITSFVAIEFAKRAEVTIPENYQHVARWYEEVSSRDSTKS